MLEVMRRILSRENSAFAPFSSRRDAWGILPLFQGAVDLRRRRAAAGEKGSPTNVAEIARSDGAGDSRTQTDPPCGPSPHEEGNSWAQRVCDASRGAHRCFTRLSALT